MVSEVNMKTINLDIVKARVSELQTDIDKVKSQLEALKESAKGKFTAEDVQKISSLKDQLLTYKAGQAELINVLNLSL